MNINNMGTENRKAAGKGTVDIGRVIRNITGAETDQEKKSFLQRLTEPKEIEDDGSKELKRAQKIARKIARGEYVTQEEKALLMKVDPKLAQMAELARKEGERIKHALQQETSKSKKQEIIHQAYQMVTQVSKSNQQFAELLGEAVKEAVKESQKKGILREGQNDNADAGQAEQRGIAAAGAGEQKEDSAADKKERRELPAAEQEDLLEQFFPEAWVSMMDCRG